MLFSAVLSASAPDELYPQGTGHGVGFDQCSTLCRLACKSFAVSTDRRKDREMAMWKTRWRDKGGKKKRKLERKGSEEIEKEKARMEGTGLSLCHCWEQ